MPDGIVILRDDVDDCKKTVLYGVYGFFYGGFTGFFTGALRHKGTVLRTIMQDR